MLKFTDALLGEHAVFYALFDEVEHIAAKAEATAELRAAARLVVSSLISHARIEEEMLFPALEPHLGPMGPIAVMRAEHEEIENLCESLLSEASLPQARGILNSLLDITRNHFAKEEHALFAMAQECLSEEDQVTFAERWAEKRKVHVAAPGMLCHG